MPEWVGTFTLSGKMELTVNAAIMPSGENSPLVPYLSNPTLHEWEWTGAGVGIGGESEEGEALARLVCCCWQSGPARWPSLTSFRVEKSG